MRWSVCSRQSLNSDSRPGRSFLCQSSAFPMSALAGRSIMIERITASLTNILHLPRVAREPVYRLPERQAATEVQKAVRE